MFAALLPILLANGAAAELTPDQVQEAVTQFTCESFLAPTLWSQPSAIASDQ